MATAAMMVQTGAADVVMAGGVESMSNVEYYTTDMRWGKRAGSVTMHDRLERGRERSQPESRFGRISGMIETAENLAREYQITREEADAFAARSHQRAAAWAEGKFAPRSCRSRAAAQGRCLLVDKDEGMRAETTVESLARMRKPS
jgi:acetyl-CoA C-acetyltransferase